jgi:hypothetical protein
LDMARNLGQEIAADEDRVIGGSGFDVDRAHFRVQGTGYRALSSGASPRKAKGRFESTSRPSERRLVLRFAVCSHSLKKVPLSKNGR